MLLSRLFTISRCQGYKNVNKQYKNEYGNFRSLIPDRGGTTKSAYIYREEGMQLTLFSESSDFVLSYF